MRDRARALSLCARVAGSYGLRLRVRVGLRLAAAGVFVCAFGVGVADGFAPVAALSVGVVGAAPGVSAGCGGVGFAPVVVAAPVSVVAGASGGSVAPPAANQAVQPPSSGRTLVKPCEIRNCAARALVCSLGQAQ
ncbi:MAG: hypothetical protein LC746_04285 [Acidobacteria bacterium]|nr:hypothetical protein [Acidobacteriota bacterium]